MNYIDITYKYSTKKHYRLKKQRYFIDNNGIKYKVDGKHVILRPTQKEIEVAKILGKTFGGIINLLPVVLHPKKIQTADYIINKQKIDLKQILGNGKNTLDTAISKKKNQSNSFIFDISNTNMSEENALLQIEKIYNAKNRTWVDMIILIKHNTVLKIFKRI